MPPAGISGIWERSIPSSRKILKNGGQHRLEVEARIGDFLRACGPEVPAGVTRVLDHDRIRQAVLAQPFLEHDADAARFREDRDQCDLREVLRHVREVEREPRAHYDGVRAAFAGLPDVLRVRRNRLHYVDRDRAAPLGGGERHPDFPVERDQVQPVQRVLIAAFLRALQEIGVVVAQLHAGNGAQRAHSRNGPGETVCRDPDSHAALHHREQGAAAQRPAWKGGFGHCGNGRTRRVKPRERSAVL